MSARVRILGPGDEAALEAFLARDAERSLILLSNVKAAGLEDHGGPHQATCAAAVDDSGSVGAAAAHAWNGVLLVRAPAHLPDVVRTAVAASGRAVAGFLGPWAEVVAARMALRLDGAPARRESREVLHALDLQRLFVPAQLASGHGRCRRPTLAELPLLAEWRAAYRIEDLNDADGPDLRAQSRDDVERGHATRTSWVLESEGRLVAYQRFNAMLPDMVQVGGVWTPPELRGRGYGRSVVAGSLLAARAGGVTRAVLFTSERNLPARRAYHALGFEPIGDYGVILLAEPARP